MRVGRFFACLLVLSGCATGEASHLPLNPLLLPVQASSAAWDNAAYGARRSKVAAHVAAHHVALLKEIAQSQTGPHLSEAYALARIPQAARPALTARLARDRAQYATSSEALVVALMVHGNEPAPQSSSICICSAIARPSR